MRRRHVRRAWSRAGGRDALLLLRGGKGRARASHPRSTPESAPPTTRDRATPRGFREARAHLSWEVRTGPPLGQSTLRAESRRVAAVRTHSPPREAPPLNGTSPRAKRPLSTKPRRARSAPSQQSPAAREAPPLNKAPPRAKRRVFRTVTYLMVRDSSALQTRAKPWREARAAARPTDS